MAFREKSEKQLLQMSREEQTAYWEEFRAYYTVQKKEITKKLRQKEAEENLKNKKKMNHARFVLFGEMIKHDEVKLFLANLAKNNTFSDKDKTDINILMKYLKWDNISF